MKSAHRVEFDYEPRPGFLYVRSRAISSRTNDNFDHFPAEEIKKGYLTFVGKPVFVNHHNDDHRRARGVIVDAALHEDRNPDGSEDTWVEVLMEIDAVKFPKLAQAIIAGHIDRTSMGTDVEYSICSVCANKAATPLDYCKHIPAMKGMKVQRTTASGEKEEVLVYEKCYGLRFFENSLLVEEPADPTAFFLGVDDRGLAMTASKQAARPPEGEPCPGEGQAVPERYIFSIRGRPHAPCPACNDTQPVNEDGTMAPHIVSKSWNRPNHPKRGAKRPSARDVGSRKRGAREAWSLTRKVASLAPRRADLMTGDPNITCVVCGKPAVYGVDSWDAKGNHTEFGLCAEHEQTFDFEPQSAIWMAASRRRILELDQGVTKVGYGEISAPADVDTLRDEACPVCGDTESFDGETCQVCGYIKPPEEFLDPDLEKAREVDLRQEGQPPTAETDLESVEQDEMAGFTEDGLPTEDTVDENGELVEAPEFADTPETDEGEPEAVEGEEPLEGAEPEQTEGEEDAEGDAGPEGDLAEGEEPAEDENAEDGEPRAQVTDDGFGGHLNEEFEELAEGSEPEDSNGSEEQEDDEDEDEDDSFPFDKKSRRLRRRRAGTGGNPTMMKRLMRAESLIRRQGRRIKELESALRFVVTAAGLQRHPRVAVLWKQAEDENPANTGWAVDSTPAPEEPFQSTDEALGDVSNDEPAGGSLDDVETPGETSESDVSPDAQTDLGSTEVVLDTPAITEDQDVTAPVAGTEDLDEGPAGEAGSGRTETEVRVGVPADESPAFAMEEGGWTEAAKSEARTYAALRLARLRIQTGTAKGDDLTLAGQINGSRMSDRDIQHEIDTLSKVVKASAQSNGNGGQRARAPRLSSRRVMPSMQEEPLIPIQTVASGPADDEFLFE